MKLIRNAVAAGFAVAAVSVAACSSQHGATGAGPGNTSAGGGSSVIGSQGQDGTGQVGMNLDIGPGTSLTSFTYVINGPSTYTNTITIGDAQSLEFVVGGIVAGGPYTITITGKDSAGDPCTGTSATFTIVAGQLTQTTLAVTCTAGADASVAANVNTGTLEVDASVKLVGTAPPVCPGITSFSISPAELAAGQSGALALLDTDPTAIIAWSVSPAGGGVFGAGAATASTANTTFTCTNTAPQVTVTATVTAASSASAALCSTQPFETMSALVNCEPPSGGFSCPPQFGDQTLTTACNVDSGTPYCANTTNDVNNCGGCGVVCNNPPVAGDVASCVASACVYSAPAATICTAAPCAASQITCSNSTGGVCSPTEAAFVQLDVTSKSTTAAGPAAGACYSCLLAGSCLDSAHVKTFECGDVTGNFTNGAGASVNFTSTCLATLSCEIGSMGQQCGLSTAGITDCYCGSEAPSPTACAAAAGAVNGPCLTADLAGYKYASTDSNDIVVNFTDSTQPSGLANSLIACASANTCSACLQ